MSWPISLSNMCVPLKSGKPRSNCWKCWNPDLNGSGSVLFGNISNNKTFTQVTSPLGSRAAMRVGSSPFRRTTSEQSPLCSDVLLFLWNKRTSSACFLALCVKKWQNLWTIDCVRAILLKASTACFKALNKAPAKAASRRNRRSPDIASLKYPLFSQ